MEKVKQLSLFENTSEKNDDRDFEYLECTEEKPCIICCKWTAFWRKKRANDKTVLNELIKMYQDE